MDFATILSFHDDLPFEKMTKHSPNIFELHSPCTKPESEAFPARVAHELFWFYNFALQMMSDNNNMLVYRHKILTHCNLVQFYTNKNKVKIIFARDSKPNTITREEQIISVKVPMYAIPSTSDIRMILDAKNRIVYFTAKSLDGSTLTELSLMKIFKEYFVCLNSEDFPGYFGIDVVFFYIS